MISKKTVLVFWASRAVALMKLQHLWMLAQDQYLQHSSMDEKEAH